MIEDGFFVWLEVDSSTINGCGANTSVKGNSCAIAHATIKSELAAAPPRKYEFRKRGDMHAV